MTGPRPVAMHSWRRLTVRRVPGFIWIQFALTGKWGWSPKGYWAVRGVAKARRLGPVWVCTMRKDWAARRRAGAVQA